MFRFVLFINTVAAWYYGEGELGTAYEDLDLVRAEELAGHAYLYDFMLRRRIA